MAPLLRSATSQADRHLNDRVVSLQSFPLLLGPQKGKAIHHEKQGASELLPLDHPASGQASRTSFSWPLDVPATPAPGTCHYRPLTRGCKVMRQRMASAPVSRLLLAEVLACPPPVTPLEINDVAALCVASARFTAGQMYYHALEQLVLGYCFSRAEKPDVA